MSLADSEEGDLPHHLYSEVVEDEDQDESTALVQTNVLQHRAEDTRIIEPDMEGRQEVPPLTLRSCNLEVCPEMSFTLLHQIYSRLRQVEPRQDVMGQSSD